MIYPAYLKEKDLIGITATSNGILPERLDSLISSKKNLRKEGYKVRETKNVRTGKEPSSSAKERGREFNELVNDSKVKAIITAAGGDFLMDMLPYTDFQSLARKPKWVLGMSDPTPYLFILPTKYDIASLYGANAGYFNGEDELSYPEVVYSMFKGEYPKQSSFVEYCPDFEGIKRKKVFWRTLNGPVDIKGRLIGGCFDCLRDLVGTPFDNVKEFNERYKDEGIIWFFDIFSLSSEEFYRSLLQMKWAGWFDNAKGIVLGRVMFPNKTTSLTYNMALKKVFGKKMPLVSDIDFGHTKPCFILLNGGYGHLKAENGLGYLTQKAI